MIPVTFRPLIAWKGEQTSVRHKSQFRAAFSDTMRLLNRELKQLNATAVVVQLDVGEDDIKLDGWPKASARPKHPGVVVAFESRYGPLQYSTDRFPHWHENLRAIALGLEALRRVDRYGITRAGEQYTGWKQLTSGFGEDDARSTLASFSDWTASEIEDSHTARQAFRQALMRSHPDHGGTLEFFQQVQQAGKVLGFR